VGRRAERVAGGQGHHPDRSPGHQGVPAADADPVVAQREVGQRVSRGGHGLGQTGIAARPDQRRGEHPGGDHEAAEVEDGRHRGREEATEPAFQRQPRAEPDRHATGFLQGPGRRERSGNGPGVGQQPEGGVGAGDQDDQEGRSHHRAALQRALAGVELACLGDQQPGQAQLEQRLLDVQALGQVEHGASAQQGHRGQPGQPLPPPQPAGQQQQGDAGRRGDHRGAFRDDARDQRVERLQPVGLGRQQRRHQVDHAGQGGQGGRHPDGPSPTRCHASTSSWMTHRFYGDIDEKRMSVGSAGRFLIVLSRQIAVAGGPWAERGGAALRVLVVEDELKMARALRRGLEQEGYAVDAALDGDDGLHRATEWDYDAIVLDVLLPGLDGIEVCRRLRQAGRWAPVLMLTARDGVADRISGLDVGADDYLVKPFAFGELLARLRALVRRGSRERPAVLSVGALVLDPAAHTVTLSDQPVSLSAREFALLEFLIRHPGQVMARSAILEHVWDYNYDGLSNVVDVYIGYLRRKLERPAGQVRIRTVRGVGYGIEPA
jgi:DNA-binding response OmpR family regulator